MSWGMSVVPEQATTAWGARAIFTGRVVDLLHDRQSVRGAGAALEALTAWCNREALPALRRAAAGLEDQALWAFAVGPYRLAAHSSYGYLHVGAWVQDPTLPVTRYLVEYDVVEHHGRKPRATRHHKCVTAPDVTQAWAQVEADHRWSASCTLHLCTAFA